MFASFVQDSAEIFLPSHVWNIWIMSGCKSTEVNRTLPQWTRSDWCGSDISTMTSLVLCSQIFPQYRFCMVCCLLCALNSCCPAPPLTCPVVRVSLLLWSTRVKSNGGKCHKKSSVWSVAFFSLVIFSGLLEVSLPYFLQGCSRHLLPLLGYQVFIYHFNGCQNDFSCCSIMPYFVYLKTKSGAVYIKSSTSL